MCVPAAVLYRVDDPGAVPCVTLYSYSAVREDELTFEAGQQLVGAQVVGAGGCSPDGTLHTAASLMIAVLEGRIFLCYLACT